MTKLQSIDINEPITEFIISLNAVKNFRTFTTRSTLAILRMRMVRMKERLTRPPF
eukprot:CAMPEP_0177276240 /NCGR_PEP_ID=MMETSP0367-20130122/68151_1 /TAXON_ID=447022 ORGANISM="Scrippsiella hangoei-like, Strain SHHI-4" /NCGR_SAMPLE_ID=MMETSP0367 /ASSEMBLY_ACC=CAM_ASM_000362 /LENGTH=54 /DNA_ID=CAMNT_0018732741 /DNA_START=16 /DNA_END=177 /DNA_ORIENTATION=+